MSNRFDFLRLFFACLVFGYHSMYLAGENIFHWFPKMLSQLAHVGIHGFFVISGALVYASYERSKSLTDYAVKRLRRLYPAYFTIVVGTAIVAAIAIGAWASAMKYGLINLTFLNFLYPEIDGLFENNQTQTVNGSLWTLKIEVLFYLAAPIMAWIVVRGKTIIQKLIILSVFYIFGVVWFSYFSGHFGDIPASVTQYGDQLARQFPGQLQYFSVGIAMWLFWDKIKNPPFWLLPIGIVLILAGLYDPVFMPLRALGVGFLISFLAFAGTPRFDAARLGDLSYGIYGLHYPVVQMLVALGVFSFNRLAGYVLAIIIVVGLSLTMWRVVERPFLHPSSYYRRHEKKRMNS